jgi:EpsI family protein
MVAGVNRQQSMPLRQPFATAVPLSLDGLYGRDVRISESELTVLGVHDYLMRVYRPSRADADSSGFSLFVGYYDRQVQGKSIHSPRNCLPGSGWSAVRSDAGVLQTDNGEININRYVVQNGGNAALVLYWYQGRGRTVANEYRVKWDLLRDAMLYGRTEEALVRIVVPFATSESDATQLAQRVAVFVADGLSDALPAWPARTEVDHT